MDVNGIVVGVFFQRTWRCLWLHLHMPWHGWLSSVEIQTNVLLACQWHVMLYRKVYESVRSPKIRRKSRCAKCKDDKITLFEEYFVHQLGWHPKKFHENKKKPPHGIPTFEFSFINVNIPQIPIEPFAFFHATRRVSARETLRRFLRYCPWPPFPVDEDQGCGGSLGSWWMDGGESMVVMPDTVEYSHFEPKNSPSWKWKSSEPKLHFLGFKNVNFPDFQPQVLRHTSPSTLFRSPRVDHHEATWINRWWVLWRYGFGWLLQRVDPLTWEVYDFKQVLTSCC